MKHASRWSVLLLALGLVTSCGGGGSGSSGSDSRFEACADGTTVADRETGLLWERKTGVPAFFLVPCATQPGSCLDRNNVNNLYRWSDGGTPPSGNVYTDFLETLNAENFGGHSDWRLPTISELQSILIGPDVDFSEVENTDPLDPAMGTNPTGQSTTCEFGPCVDPGFGAVAGATANSAYWSETSSDDPSTWAWLAHFKSGILFDNFKTKDSSARAVRTGSCSS